MPVGLFVGFGCMEIWCLWFGEMGIWVLVYVCDYVFMSVCIQIMQKDMLMKMYSIIHETDTNSHIRKK